MKNTIEAQQEPLQNAINYNNLDVKLNIWCYEDKRKQSQFYLTDKKGNSISPKLDYDNMNHFILGFSTALKTQN